MVVIQFKNVEPGQEFVLSRIDEDYANHIRAEVCVATDDGRGVSCHDGSFIDMNMEEYVIAEYESKLSER